MPAWPTDLPSPLLGGYSESPPNMVIASSTDTGPGKVRLRTTAGVRPLQWSFILTAAQVASLDTFFITTIKGGSLSFTATDPRTSVSGTYRMKGYDLTRNGLLYSASVEILLLP